MMSVKCALPNSGSEFLMRVAASFLLAACLCTAQNRDSEAIFNQALSAQQRGDLQTAIADYESALKLVPDLLPARVNLATAQMQLGRADQALDNYRAAHKGAPGDAQITLLFGNALFQMAQYADAIAVLSPLEKAHPENLDVAFMLGETLIRSQRPREGLKLVDRVAKTRNDADAYLLAGLTQMQLTEYPQAELSAGEAVRLEPANSAAWTLKGMANAAGGDLQSAETAYRKALELNPNDFDANLRIGTLLLRMDHDVTNAEPFLDHALQIDPSSLAARFEIANLQAELGDDAAAIANFEQIVARKPEATEAHVQLSALYLRAKHKDDAKRERAIVDKLLDAERVNATGARSQTKNPEDELAAFSSASPSQK